MFNGEQKQQYINYTIDKSNSKNIDLAKRKMENFFERLAGAERRIGKDCADMENEEAERLLSEIATVSKNSIEVAKSLLIWYVEWCINNGHSIQQNNNFKNIGIDKISNTKTQAESMVRGEKELINYLDIILKNRAEDTIDNMYRVYILLLYAGFDVNEIVMIRETDIDWHLNKITHKGHVVAMSQALAEEAKYFMDMNYFCFKRGAGIGTTQITRTGYLIENGTDFEKKSVSGYREKTLANSLNVSICKRLSSGEKKLSQTNIILSGIFRRIYENEIKGNEIDVVEYLVFKKNNKKTIRALNMVVNEANYEYNSWKKAFQL